MRQIHFIALGDAPVEQNLALSREPKESECRRAYFSLSEIGSFIVDSFKSPLQDLFKFGARQTVYDINGFRCAVKIFSGSWVSFANSKIQVKYLGILFPVMKDF